MVPRINQEKEMAIKIVQSEPDSSVIKQKICDHCGVSLKFLPQDLFLYCEHLCIECPKCKEYIIIKEAKIPWILLGYTISAILWLIRYYSIAQIAWVFIMAPIILGITIKIGAHFYIKRSKNI